MRKPNNNKENQMEPVMERDKDIGAMLGLIRKITNVNVLYSLQMCVSCTSNIPQHDIGSSVGLKGSPSTIRPKTL